MFEQVVWQNSEGWVQVVNLKFLLSSLSLSTSFFFFIFPTLKRNHHAQKKLCFCCSEQFSTSLPQSLPKPFPGVYLLRKTTGCWQIVLMAPIKKFHCVGKNWIPIEPEDECKKDPYSSSPWEPNPPSLLSCLPLWEVHTSPLGSLRDPIYICKVEQSCEENQCLPPAYGSGLLSGCWASGNQIWLHQVP